MHAPPTFRDADPITLAPLPGGSMNMIMVDKPFPIRTLAAGAVLAFGLMAPATATAQHAHVHGVARLELAVDGQRVSLRLESPLENLLGFERAPRTDKEKVAVRSMAERLARPDALFALTAAARCTAASTRIDAPVVGLAGKPGADAQTVAPGKAGPGGAKKGADAGHAELQAQFVFQCEDAARLQGVEVRLFEAFQRLRQLDVQAVTPRGQKSVRLTPSKPQLTW
jgi:hypothetical protein